MTDSKKLQKSVNFLNQNVFPSGAFQVDSQRRLTKLTSEEIEAMKLILKNIGGETVRLLTPNPHNPKENTMYDFVIRAFKLHKGNYPPIPFAVDRKLLAELNPVAFLLYPKYPTNCTYTLKQTTYELQFNDTLMDVIMAWISALECRTVDMPITKEDILIVAKIDQVRENVMYWMKILSEKSFDPRSIRLLVQVWNLWNVYVFAKQRRPDVFHESVRRAFGKCWSVLIGALEVSEIRKFINAGFNPTKSMTPEEVLSLKQFLNFMVQLLTEEFPRRSVLRSASKWVPFPGWWGNKTKAEELQQIYIGLTTNLIELLMSRGGSTKRSHSAGN